MYDILQLLWNFDEACSMQSFAKGQSKVAIGHSLIGDVTKVMDFDSFYVG